MADRTRAEAAQATGQAQGGHPHAGTACGADGRREPSMALVPRAQGQRARRPRATRAAPTSTSGAAPSTCASWPAGSTTRSTGSWFRVEWEGLEKIPTDGGALLVANHAGAIPSDAPVIMHGIETELGRPGLRPGRPPLQGACRSSARCGPAPAASSPTPTTPTGCCASSSSSCSCSPRAPRARARPTASATSCAASAGAASSRSPCGPACRSSRSPSSAPRSRCRSLFKIARWPRRSASRTSRSPPTCSRSGRSGWSPTSRPSSSCGCSTRCTSTCEPDQPRYSRSRIMDESEAHPAADPGGALRHAPPAPSRSGSG